MNEKSMNLDEIISAMNLGEIIKDARERKEILWTELAMYAGISKDYIIKIENNDRLPDFNTALLIKRFLGLDIDLAWVQVFDDVGMI